MPQAEAIAATERFRARLLALDAQAATELSEAYQSIWLSIEAEVEAIAGVGEAAQVARKTPSIDELQRLRALQAQVLQEVSRYADAAGTRITQGQARAVDLARAASRTIADAALPLGIDSSILARAGISWHVLPREAFELFVGISGDGAPLGDLLSTLGPEAAQGVREGIAEGIAMGRGPRATAAIVRNRFGLPLTRALTVSRTEMQRAYREATRLDYEANTHIVQGYERHSAQDERVCMACIALDGLRYETAVPLDEHVNGRCAIVPVVIGYRDLGLDIPDEARPTDSARTWFGGQPPAVQRRMMGPGKFAAWNEGAFALEDMAKIVPSPTWGPSAVEASLKDLVG